MPGIKRRVKVSWLRLRRWVIRKTTNYDELSDSQKMGIKIFEKSLMIEGADIFISPLSDSIYIEVNDIYLILERDDLQIINGKFQYDLKYPDAVRLKLLNRVFSVLEKRRVEVEKRIKAKSDRTLSSILEEVKIIKENEKS